MNPLYSNNNVSQLKSLYNLFRQNPQQVIMQMAQTNPQVAQVLNMTKNQNLETVFYNMCQQRGISPNEILDQIR